MGKEERLCQACGRILRISNPTNFCRVGVCVSKRRIEMQKRKSRKKVIPCMLCGKLRTSTWEGDRLCSVCRNRQARKTDARHRAKDIRLEDL